MLEERRRAGDMPDGREIPELVSLALGTSADFNCYPGGPSKGCHPLVVVLSLNSMDGGRGNYDFREALERAVRHTQGACHGKTRALLFLTDAWDADAWNDWRGNVASIAQECASEFYLLAGAQAWRVG